MLPRAVLTITPFECDHPIERPASVVAARASLTAYSRLSSGHAKRVAFRWRLPGCPVIPAPHLTPTRVTYYGAYKSNDYSCVTAKSFVDNEIRKSTLSGRVLPIICVTRNSLVYREICQTPLQITRFNDYACVTHNHKGSRTLRQIAAVPIIPVSHVSFRPVIRCSRMAVFRPDKVCALFKRRGSASSAARRAFRPPESVGATEISCITREAVTSARPSAI